MLVETISAGAKTSMLDQFLSAYEFSEFHRATIHAPINAAYAAIKDVSLSETSVVVKWLLSLRALPDRLTGNKHTNLATDRPLIEAMCDNGFVLLSDEPGSEIVIGMIEQPWRIIGGKKALISDAAAFLHSDKPDYARVITNLIATAGDLPGEVLCTTETRVHVPEPRARQLFAFYWTSTGIGSALIRRMWLNAIKRRAERNGFAVRKTS